MWVWRVSILKIMSAPKTVKIMQGFSFEFEDAKTMIAILVPGVNNLDADHTFDDEAMNKRFSLGRC